MGLSVSRGASNLCSRTPPPKPARRREQTRRDSYQKMSPEEGKGAGPALSAAHLWLSIMLDTLEKIRADLKQDQIEVPGVVVCGDQSSGKSSLLESLTGVPFPRASSTCTRTPAIVRLQVDPGSKPYILISREASLDPHDAATIRLEEGELDEVTDHIQQLTEDLAGQHDIEDEPIHIKYVRPEGLAFTIIDLPGITHKLAYEEAREMKVFDKTCDLVRKYVKQKDMVILCVIPANTDFGNAAALSIAEEVDPKGLRTLGVITKIDMVPDKYSDVVEHIRMESPKSIKLELGYYAVRNRTPEELDRRVGLDEVKQAEKTLFETHPLLCKVPDDRRGVKALATRIAQLQKPAMQNFVEMIKGKLKKEVGELKKELKSFRKPCLDEASAQHVLYDVLDKVSTNLDKLIKGQLVWEDDAGKELNLQARTFADFKKITEGLRDDTPDFFAEDIAAELREKLPDHLGGAPANFVGGAVFEGEMRRVIEDLLPPAAEEMREQLRTRVEEALKRLVSTHTDGYPVLRRKLQGALLEWVDECVEEAGVAHEDLIESELSWFNSSDPDYADLIGKAHQHLRQEQERLAMRAQRPAARFASAETASAILPLNVTKRLEEVAPLAASTSNEELALLETQISLWAYTKIVLQNFSDSAWKQARMRLLTRLQKDLRSTMVARLRAEAEDEALLPLMAEATDREALRQSLTARLGRFENALAELKKLR